ncbi:putative ABC transporter ATP-binding protein [Labrenzia sp. THAF82]|uniref:ATP-binding cassette domain-containing protein n=1 Tax=Labrenzia sp. THAF82 TaxID=2587861 RepID=UPI0012684DBB|nr:ABC transporter ATP-binding protein [Labrenzia sp. THAF82]QFT29550.1 putative ABC transporter ATP-binding protein [Labrenzia sp. THAF82]
MMIELLIEIAKKQKTYAKVGLLVAIVTSITFSLLNTLSTYFLSKAFSLAEKSSDEFVGMLVYFVLTFVVARLLFEPRWIAYALWDGEYIKSYLSKTYVEAMRGLSPNSESRERIASRLMHSSKSLREFTTNVIFSIIPVIFDVLFSISVIAIFYSHLIISFSFTIFVYFLFNHYALLKLKGLAADTRDTQTRVDSVLTSLMIASDETLALNAINKSSKLLSIYLEKSRDAILKYNLKRSILALVQFSPILLSIIFHNIYFYQGYTSGSVDLSAVILVNMLLFTLTRRLEMLSTSIRQAQLSWSFVSATWDLISNTATSFRSQDTPNSEAEFQIECRNVEIRGARLTSALKNLRVHKGDKLALVGPSGCGKSSLLRAIARLIPIKRGEIIIRHDTSAYIPRLSRPDVTYNSASPVIYPTTLTENLHFFDRDTNVSAYEILKSLDLAIPADNEIDFSSNAPSFSQGQLKRIHLARAITSNAPIILIDEPFANIEKRLARKISDLLVNLDCTVIIATQDADNTDNFSRVIHFQEQEDKSVEYN